MTWQASIFSNNDFFRNYVIKAVVFAGSRAKKDEI
jgi:hypothetical protein